MRARAFSVTRRAQIVNLGKSQMRASSVTVPTMTAVSPSRPGFFMDLTILAMEIGGLLILLINKRFKMILLNLDPVRRARNLYN